MPFRLRACYNERGLTAQLLRSADQYSAEYFGNFADVIQLRKWMICPTLPGDGITAVDTNTDRPTGFVSDILFNTATALLFHEITASLPASDQGRLKFRSTSARRNDDKVSQ